MPSHIFTRVGTWEDSVATNLRSREAAKKGGEPNEAYHASDYAVYAYLQLGRDSDARRLMEDVLKVTDFNQAAPGRGARYAMAAMPARYALERGAWREAMQLAPQPSDVPYTDAITYFARALGAVRSGDPAAAEKDAAALARLHKALQDAKDNYWATEVEVQRLAIAGWIALAQGRTDEAVTSMRAAADLEDRNEKSIVTPGRVVPARELLGDMLLELKQPALALKAFEASQEREPNRFRGLYGAARAAEAAGDRQKAADYYAKVTSLAKNGDTSRPEIARARAYIAQR
jgi:tetratricopeptide (TPR) repeat protein